ncbi:Protein CBG03454 [Caenorhabditis briggsae]|uniref:H/ACA ribonucleoprotein complex non-core subunit NAF1 n=2 Tax=Caenorhabditis briggsae TaxID=6238 RepID=A8WV38_CAEBR|nr:Protein CBG03454 [Caenorhabditis briggsae]ULT95987.1 hypothetical protein L3Y34_004565 [Caenorhabditis briggsae]CAP24349.1 Protein CBG03454 [Caenorhabditis briggsae]
MAEKTMKEGIEEDFITDRNPVPLAFCAHPTPIAPENKNQEDDIVEQILELVDPIVVSNQNETRQASSIKSYGGDTESEFELSEDDSDFENLKDVRAGAFDSDEEFDRLVKYSAKIIEKTHKSEYPGENDTRKNRKTKNSQKTANIREYDDLPPLENLSIECKSQLIEFGYVSKVVDCQVVIVSTCNEVLDFDSFLFDEKRNAIGQVYDIFGQVKSPQYVIRFNSSEEAALIPINMKMFYAPTEKEFSKTPFKGLNLAAANRDTIQSLNRQLDHQAAVQKANDRSYVPEVDSDVEFSDDEAEKEYRRNTQPQSASGRQSFEPNRGGRKRDRRGGQRVQFASNAPAPKPYRRDHDGPITASSTTPSFTPSVIPSPTPAPPSRPPQSTESNPYAEFGCYSGFGRRFGI